MSSNNNSDLDPESSLIRTIASRELTELGADVSEAVFDQLMEPGVVRDLPIVGSFLGIAKAGLAVRDALLVRKIFRFLSHLASVPEAERVEFAERIRTDPKYRSRVGENLVVTLDGLSQVEKADMIGRIYRAHLMGEIEPVDVERLISATNLLRLHDLPFLRGFYLDTMPFDRQQEAQQGLAFAGLVHISFGSGATWGGSGGSYVSCELGEMFVRIALD